MMMQTQYATDGSGRCGSTVRSLAISQSIPTNNELQTRTFQGAKASNLNYTYSDSISGATVTIATYLLQDKLRLMSGSLTYELIAGDLVMLYIIAWPVAWDPLLQLCLRIDIPPIRM